MDGKVLSAKQVAAHLGIGMNSVYDLMHQPEFPKFKMGNRYKVSSVKLDEWVAARAKTEAETIHRLLRNHGIAGGTNE